MAAFRKKSVVKPFKADPPPANIESPPEPAPDPAATPQDWELEFPLVCLGASAGGLEALKSVFSNLDPATACAYIVIMHLQADTKSHLTDILIHYTTLHVVQITDAMPVLPNNVYVIPPNVDVQLTDGHFHLTKRKRPARRLPIDLFLCSLAAVAKERAAAVILSGSGSDGAEGVRAIKAEAGLVIAQEPTSARFDSMPLSAINTGIVDFVLDPEKIPNKIKDYFHEIQEVESTATADANNKKVLVDILFQLKKRSGHDFTNYKPNTLLRRIHRRMAINHVDDMAAYARLLHSQSQEVNILFRELLIGVTSFMRDPTAWKLLYDKVLPEAVKDKPAGYSFRAWVAGTGTGEEAYSLAITLQRYVDEHQLDLPFQIFATDINDESIETARLGMYAPSIIDALGQEDLDRYFEKEGIAYRVSRLIREKVIFAPQNILRDPPFTKLDLICCRNVLIYLDNQVQQKVMAIFHFSLKPGGILFLGTSETIGDFPDLFQVIDSRWKIFRRRHGDALQTAIELAPRQVDSHLAHESREASPTLVQMVERALVEHFAPPSLVVDKLGEIFYIHGRTGRYLEPAQGRARLNLFEMARPGLRGRLPGLIRNASEQNKPINCQGIRLESDGSNLELNINIEPLHTASLEGLFLVSFREYTTDRLKGKAVPTNDTAYVEDLQREIENMSANLKTTIEELETSNEELRSVNEEYQSMNEELQSANEELESSREEMQSLNEELATVNEELQEKVEGLTQLHEIMRGFLDSMDLPAIFLDNNLCIKRFTRQASQLVSIMDQDIGRPLSHLSTHLKHDGLMDDAKTVADQHKPLDREIQTRKGDWYLMRMAPYRLAANANEGVVISFANIKRYKH